LKGAIRQHCLDKGYIYSGEWWQTQGCYRLLEDGTYKEVAFWKINGKLEEVDFDA